MWDRLWDTFAITDIEELTVHFATIAIAALLALPVGWDRERSSRQMGLRTFPLVAVASAGYVLVASTALGTDSDAAHARIIQGLMTGIGFLGGGAILKTGDRVKGTATAASIWSTAAIGAAVAYHRVDVAILLSATNFLALRVLQPVKKLVRKDGVEEAPPEDAERAMGPSLDEAKHE